MDEIPSRLENPTPRGSFTVDATFVSPNSGQYFRVAAEYDTQVKLQPIDNNGKAIEDKKYTIVDIISARKFLVPVNLKIQGVGQGTKNNVSALITT